MAKAQKKEPVAAATDDRKRGWKSQLIRELKTQHPHLTHAALADEFHKNSGEQVSIPTIIQALKDARDNKTSGRGETINDLMKVKKWCADSSIKPEALAQQIAQLNELASKVGGMTALSRILTAIQSLRE